MSECWLWSPVFRVTQGNEIQSVIARRNRLQFGQLVERSGVNYSLENTCHVLQPDSDLCPSWTYLVQLKGFQFLTPHWSDFLAGRRAMLKVIASINGTLYGAIKHILLKPSDDTLSGSFWTSHILSVWPTCRIVVRTKWERREPCALPELFGEKVEYKCIK